MSVHSGQIARGADHNNDVRKLLRRASRNSSSSTTTTTELPVLRLDSAPLKAGRGYLIIANNLVLSSTVNNDSIVARFRTTSNASTPDLTSTLRAELRLQTLDAQGQASGVLAFTYYPTTDDNFSVLLTVIRISGTGNVSISTLGSGIQFEIIDLGPDPGNVGVAL